MHFLFVTIILWLITVNDFAFGDHNIQLTIQNELKELNASCTPHDTCTEPRTSESLDVFACQCGAICVQLDTCCTDSPYSAVTPSEIRPTCRSLDRDRAYFMVDHCSKTDSNYSVWVRLCEEDWNGEDNIMQIVPVTSLFTQITYKNYFCLMCHEKTDEYFYWNIELETADYLYNRLADKNKLSALKYDRDNKTWVAPIGPEDTLIPVKLNLLIPEQIVPLPIECDQEVIQNCSDTWTDKDVSDKCEAYMGIVYYERNDTLTKYRNVHCAICNFEDSNDKLCKWRKSVNFDGKVPFSFTHLLDINQHDGEKVGKTQKCEDGLLWDPFTKTCKKLVCALSGHVIKDGKCAPP